MQSVSVTASSVLRLIEQQKHRCALTGWTLTPETATLDHKQPLSREGLHDIRNVWIVHKDVNAAKGTMLTEEFMEMCRAVVAHADAKTDGQSFATNEPPPVVIGSFPVA